MGKRSSNTQLLKFFEILSFSAKRIMARLQRGQTTFQIARDSTTLRVFVSHRAILPISYRLDQKQIRRK